MKQEKKDIEKLEKQKEGILKEIGELGDIHRGTVYFQYRKCGQKNCRCHKKGEKGHGPYYLLTYKNKHQETKAVALNTEGKIEKANREVENFREYSRRKINREIS